eukprot:GCRY01001994.1.p1 GENE.GCRY01001994.1~~GCRY01001994.1.p1  ORF type:complete len:202 (-),score=13.56 GCRY01001994.1:324-929(-)
MSESYLPTYVNAPPLDFSWKNIENIDDILVEEPSNGKKKSEQSEKRQKVVNGKIVEEKKRLVHRVSGFRINNNELSTVGNLRSALSQVLTDVDHIMWLDFSFNNLSAIEDPFFEFPNLTTLYLHGNNISDLKELQKLSRLQNLKTLTLHGNPVEENNRDYRWRVISLLPNLRTLDFSPVTKNDRFQAESWRTLPRKKAQKP